MKPVLTVSGQNTICVYIILLAFIQFAGNEQNVVCNNQFLQLQLAITIRNKTLYAIQWTTAFPSPDLTAFWI